MNRSVLLMIYLSISQIEIFHFTMHFDVITNIHGIKICIIQYATHAILL